MRDKINAIFDTNYWVVMCEANTHTSFSTTHPANAKSPTDVTAGCNSTDLSDMHV